MLNLYFFIYSFSLFFEAKRLKVIPVIDILNGIVVHAIRGNRQEYKPLHSIFTGSIDPVEVATVFKLQGFSTLYLADIDAIQGKKPCFKLYKHLVNIGFNLMVDAGVTDIQTVKKLLKCGVSKVIVGTETLHSKIFLQNAIRQVGSDKIIVSFDMKNGKIIIPQTFHESLSDSNDVDVFELFEVFSTMGVSEFILLDLTRVGSAEGVNVEVLKKFLLSANCFYVGGGIRNIDDLLMLKELNVLGVLTATALHLGKICVNDLKVANLL